MDCRKVWVAASFSLVTGLMGCTSQSLVPSEKTTTPPIAQSSQSSGEAKVTPKALTCVAGGHALETEANDPRCDSMTKERLRDRARVAYQQAIEVDPSCLPAYRKLANLYGTIGDHDRAIATCRRGIQKQPREHGLWFDLGLCYSRQKDWPKAIEGFQKAVELDPENRQYLNTLGHCQARAGLVEDSLATFRKTVGPARAHYNVARMLHHMKQESQARQHLMAALQADPGLEAAQQFLAHLDGRAPLQPGAVMPAGFEDVGDSPLTR